jgi:tetratricopeptide (TPR) repeat protein
MKPFCIAFLFFIFWPLKFFSQEIEELKQDLNIAVLEKDTLGMSRIWYRIGRHYDHQNQSVNSNNAFRQALSLAKNIHNENAISTISNYLASNYSISGEKDSAFLYYNIALEACVKTGDSLKLATVLSNMGDEYSAGGNYTEAIKHSLRAIRLKETQKDSASLAYFYQKAGEIYKSAGENQKWMEYIRKAYGLIHNPEYAPPKAVAAIYNDLGGIAEQQGDYNQALLYYDTLAAHGKKHDYPHAIGIALTNRATIYKLQGETGKALLAADEALNHLAPSPYQEIYHHNLLAELNFETGNLSEAIEYCNRVIQNSNSKNFPEEKMRAYKNLHLIEETNQNYERALLWHKKFKQISDSIRDKEVRTHIVELEMAYETDKKEQQIELLSAENHIKNQRLRVGVFLLTALSVVILLILYILQMRRKQAALVQNDLQQQLLRSQMNPHFIFNVLGSIQNFMMQNDTRKASNYLSQFASLTRATLNNSVAETISLTDEINMLRNYIELEKMRKADNFNFEIIYDENIETDFIQIPPMLIQPFIENAIKHGFRDIEHNGFLRLQITDKTNWVEFIIEDNGIGISKMEKGKNGHKSMAMNIFEKRRKLIQQKYKKDFKFDIRNLNETNTKLSGVKITIGIPILNND